MRTILTAVLLTGALSAAASAQSFSVDFGSAFGGPTSPYSAASTHPATATTWQTIASVTGGMGVAVTGLPGVTITSSATFAGFSFSNPAFTGSGAALMNDCLDLGGAGASGTFTIAGLAAGSYQVYTYAWAPDSATFLTGVNTSFGGVSAGSQTVGGTAPGGSAFLLGTTHAFHTGSITAGQTISIACTTVSGFGSLNGIQIVRVPAPAGLALLGAAGLIGRRRRR